MSVPLSRKLYDDGDGHLTFWCPGCEMLHSVWTEHTNSLGAKWGWNRDAERPTFTPSILVRYEHWVPPAVHGQPAPANQVKVNDVCHMFVADGRIQFLGDCTHALAGQTVDLPDLPDWLLE